MGRAGTRLRKLHLGGMLRSHEPPPWDAACDARLHTATSPAKRSIFGIAGDRPCTPRLSPHQLPQALWEDIWERIDMPNQKSYEVSIHPVSTPGEPMPDPAVGGEVLEAVGWNKSRYFESQEEALAEAKSMV